MAPLSENILNKIDDILNILPSEEVEGTEINIIDSANARIKDIKLCGDINQDSYDGYNRLDTSKFGSSQVKNGMQMDLTDNGKILLNGTTTNKTNFWITELNETLKAGTYTFSTNNTINGCVVLYDKDGNSIFISRVSITFTLKEDTITSHLLIQIDQETTYENQEFELMIYSGTDEKEYEPYVGGQASPNPDYPQEIEVVTGDIIVKIDDGDSIEKEITLSLDDLELCGDDEYGRDYLSKKAGKWYKHKLWNKQIFMGEEDFESFVDGDKTFLYCPTTSTSTNYAKIFSNYFTYSSSYANALSGNKVVIRMEGNSIYFCVDTTTIDDFKSWLQECYNNGNPVIAYYPLVTAIDEEITDTILLSQLESLLNMKTYKDVTNISVTSNNLQPALKIEYYQDIERLINNINNSSSDEES